MLRDWRETNHLVIREREGEHDGNSHKSRGRRKRSWVLKMMEKLKAKSTASEPRPPAWRKLVLLGPREMSGSAEQWDRARDLTLKSEWEAKKINCCRKLLLSKSLAMIRWR